MSIERVKKLIEDAGVGYLVTSDGEEVGVRPMAAIAWFGDEMWNATFAGSAKTRHIEKNPNAEYCFLDKDGAHVRLAGTCEISSDGAVRKKMFEAYPPLQDLVGSPDNPDFLVIIFKPGRIRLMAPGTMEYVDVETP